MGRLFLQYVDADVVHCCASCGTHLAAHDTIVSKAFQGRHGRAYLFSDVINVNTGPEENRLLLTGLHVVSDIFCNSCDTRLGWKYIEALEENQKYKEGKFILEKEMIMKEAEMRRRDDDGLMLNSAGGSSPGSAHSNSQHSPEAEAQAASVSSD
uniref:Protein yippee-like n=1 Tax=Chrysotila carterae TaxID=13221 RepID=A0A6T0DRN4_CHRCT|mmetsp:Transcript_2611/g.5506  ORF Transcript_2611/g.5506 Transcript_2611/m.5506 type:complete len:154 (-) Transcript_2611:184-645(-)|eukprot:4776367-Pleurochrysis_carterae.AAC.2